MHKTRLTSNDLQDLVDSFANMSEDIPDFQPFAQPLSDSDDHPFLPLAQDKTITVSWESKRIWTEPISADPVADRELQLLDSLVCLREKG